MTVKVPGQAGQDEGQLSRQRAGAAEAEGQWQRVAAGGGVRREGLSLQLSRRVNVVLIVVAAVLLALLLRLRLRLRLPLLLLLLTRLLFYAKDDSRNCASGRWARLAEAVQAKLEKEEATSRREKATKSGKFYGQRQQKLQYTVASSSRGGEGSRAGQQHPSIADWP